MNRSGRTVLIVVLLLVLAIVGYFLADWARSSTAEIQPSFVGRQSCVECHQAEAALYEGSHHDLSMDLATEATVLANFNDQTLEHHGITSRMFRRDGKFFINTEGPSGAMSDFEIKYVFGFTPLQQYMVELERPAGAQPDEIGKVQVLRVSWDTEKKRWFYLNPPDVADKLEPADPLHWTGITQNWNLSCASCHSTDLKRNFDLLSKTYHTTFSEIDVSCEACHGPGSFHVELANRKSLFWDRQQGFGLAKLKTTSNVAQVESCAPCHSRRTALRDGFQPGCNFDDYYALQLVVDPIYHVDGQVRDEDYVYGSFIQSKMYHKDIRCSDCHDPHSAKLKFTGNATCTNCHQHPAGKYDSPSHHHHEPGTAGASCVACHMPTTTYMSVDVRHDHSFRIPRPDISVKLGTPNACTACHLETSETAQALVAIGMNSEPETKRLPRKLDQYLDWIIAAEAGDARVAAELARIDAAMAEATATWYPTALPEHSTYYAELAEALTERQPLESRVPTLEKMAVDRAVPAMLRASAVAALAEDLQPSTLAVAMKLTADDDAKVVMAALRRLDAEIMQVMQRQRFDSSTSIGRTSVELSPVIKRVVSLLGHDSLGVRIEAARVFCALDEQTRFSQTTPDERRQFSKALAELKETLALESDRANSHLMLGSIYELLGEFDQAKSEYRAAISVEPTLPGPRKNLSVLLERDAQRLQQQMQSMRPQGSVRADQLENMQQQIRQVGQQMMRVAQQVDELRAEEHQLLAKDIERSKQMPGTHGLHYRFAMSSYTQGDLAATEKHLLEAYRQEPATPTYLLGLATYYVEVREPEKALPLVNALLEQDPGNLGYQSLLAAVREMQAGQSASQQQ